MRTILTAAAAVLLLSGCAASGVSMGTVNPTSVRVPVSETNYVLGEERTAVVGEQVIRVKDYVETRTSTPSMRPDREATFTLGMTMGMVSPLMDYVIYGERNVEGQHFTIIGLAGTGIQIRDDGTPHNKGLLDGGYGSWIEPIPDMVFTPANVVFRPSARTTSRQTASGENYEIVFTGRDASSMRFQYREYTSDDMARAAFSQDLTYPVTARTVRFRGLTIDIVALGEDSITYRVMSREVQSEPAEASGKASQDADGNPTPAS